MTTKKASQKNKISRTQNKDLTISILVDTTPAKAFKAINNVRGWWSEELKGKSDQVGARFTYRYKDMHESTQKVTELIPGKKVVWHVEKGSLFFLKNQDEWNGTDVVFKITKKTNKTQIRLTHIGLSKDCECFQACLDGWSYYVRKSLRSLIKTGKGKPNPEE